MSVYVVVWTRGDPMMGKVWARQHRHVAVLEIDPAHAVAARILGKPWRPERISLREPGVTRIVERWNDCYVGRTPRCAFKRALDEAEELAAKLNRERARSASPAEIIVAVGEQSCG